MISETMVSLAAVQLDVTIFSFNKVASSPSWLYCYGFWKCRQTWYNAPSIARWFWQVFLLLPCNVGSLSPSIYRLKYTACNNFKMRKKLIYTFMQKLDYGQGVNFVFVFLDCCSQMCKTSLLSIEQWCALQCVHSLHVLFLSPLKKQWNSLATIAVD